MEKSRFQCSSSGSVGSCKSENFRILPSLFYLTIGGKECLLRPDSLCKSGQNPCVMVDTTRACGANGIEGFHKLYFLSGTL